MVDGDSCQPKSSLPYQVPSTVPCTALAACVPVGHWSQMYHRPPICRSSLCHLDYRYHQRLTITSGLLRGIFHCHIVVGLNFSGFSLFCISLPPWCAFSSTLQNFLGSASYGSTSWSSAALIFFATPLDLIFREPFSFVISIMVCLRSTPLLYEVLSAGLKWHLKQTPSRVLHGCTRFY